MIEKIVGFIRKYDAEKHIYFMTANDDAIKKVMEYAPDIKCCVGWDGNHNPMAMVERAIALKAYKIQFFKPYYSKEAIDKAHANGILCNMFWSDDVKEAEQFIDMGIDTILTNDYNSISQAIKR